MEFCLSTLHRGTSLAYLMAGKKNHLDNHVFRQRQLGKHLCSTPTLFCPPRSASQLLRFSRVHSFSSCILRLQEERAIRSFSKERVHRYVCVCAKSHQSCPTLCNHTDCSPPGSSVHGILQAGIPEWVVVLFSRGSSWPRDQTQVSCIAGKFFTTEPLEEPRYVYREAYRWISPSWALFSWEGLSPKQLRRKSLFYLPQDGKLL